MKTMTDVHDRATRSKNMKAIRAENTRPEKYIRSLLHRQGFRFRIHCPELPSKPDIYLPRYNAVIWIHGCFWHGHDCHLFKWPKSNPERWREKIQGNRQRDRNKRLALHEQHIRILTVWECALKGKERLSEQELVARLEEWLLNIDHDCDISGEGLFQTDVVD
nr:DNA mismatch endonuclease Vsr [Oceanospirillum sediminis]